MAALDMYGTVTIQILHPYTSAHYNNKKGYQQTKDFRYVILFFAAIGFLTLALVLNCVKVWENPTSNSE